MKDTDFCPTCKNYLYLTQVAPNAVLPLPAGPLLVGPFTSVDSDGETLRRLCRNCGYQAEDKKGGLILEMNLKEKISEGYKILMNEFTKHDPTLPHVNTIKCPNSLCNTNTSNKQKDVIYLKYDAVNMKFLYICNNCDTQWRSKT
jgi:DNA-directed RNA polymerase subunit M/transcription elongation factor TFIIS